MIMMNHKTLLGGAETGRGGDKSRRSQVEWRFRQTSDSKKREEREGMSNESCD